MDKCKNANPYIINGRWYQIFIESDNTNVKITQSDIPVTIENGYLKFPSGFHVIERQYDINSIEHSGDVSIAIDLRGFTDGTQGIYLPLAKAFDYAHIYVFGHY